MHIRTKELSGALDGLEASKGQKHTAQNKDKEDCGQHVLGDTRTARYQGWLGLQPQDGNSVECYNLEDNWGYGRSLANAMNVLTEEKWPQRLRTSLGQAPVLATLTGTTHWALPALSLWWKENCYREIAFLCAMRKKGIEGAPSVSHRIQMSLLA